MLVTPGMYLKLAAGFAECSLHWVLVDKVDVHLALDLKEELMQLAADLPACRKLIISTNMKDKLDDESKEVR